jgi:hypothetical protein
MNPEDQGHIPEDMHGEKSTHVAVVLDRSGSMGSIRDEIIEAFNEQVASIRENAESGGHTTVSFYTFGGNYRGNQMWSTGGQILSGSDPLDPPYGTEETQGRKPVERKFKFREPGSLPELSRANYRPSGATPMYDAVGLAISDMVEMDDGGDQTAFLMLIISDGRENHSRQWGGSQISTLVKALENTGRWTFVYIGANQDLSEAVDLGFAPGNVVSFTADAAGVRGMSAGTGMASSAYFADRAQGRTQVENYGDTVAEHNPDGSSESWSDWEDDLTETSD